MRRNYKLRVTKNPSFLAEGDDTSLSVFNLGQPTDT